MSPERIETKVLVWDTPARVCHWGFALSFTATLVVAFRHDPESDLFKYHMPLGLLAAWFLAVRIVLGFLGCPLHRWRAFLHDPRSTLRYFADVFRWRAAEPEGLNPGTSLFAIAIYLAVVALIFSGFIADWSETWHGRIAWTGVGLIGCHLLGLTLHAMRYRALTPLAMVHGKRLNGPGNVPAQAHPIVGISLLVVSLLLAGVICGYFDPDLSVLHIPLFPEIYFPLIQKG